MKGGEFRLNRFHKMLERVNIQMIADMIQMGNPKAELYKNNLEEREDEAVRQLKKRLEEFLSGKELGRATDIAMEYANDCCEIYFTIGMKAGTKLLFQLLNDSLKDT